MAPTVYFFYTGRRECDPCTGNFTLNLSRRGTVRGPESVSYYFSLEDVMAESEKKEVAKSESKNVVEQVGRIVGEVAGGAVWLTFAAFSLANGHAKGKKLDFSPESRTAGLKTFRKVGGDIGEKAVTSALGVVVGAAIGKASS